MIVDVPESKFLESPEQAQKFAARFSRYRPLLYSLAWRVLGDIQGAENAVENCWRTAFSNLPEFDYEGAFRVWLARVLIDEAFTILRKTRTDVPTRSILVR
jgi:DNA-directed RNA polymerase specialized sigma24 family protein